MSSATHARFPTGPFEVHVQRAWFGVEFIDPVTFDSIRSQLNVSLLGSAAPPIVTSSGRFVWLTPAQAYPQTVRLEDSSRRYASRDYFIDPPLPLPRPQLFRLLLEPTPGYAFGSDVTLLRGQLIETRPAAGTEPNGIGDARVRLRWRNRQGDPSMIVDADGPSARCGEQGHFACALPLPPGARPQLLGATDDLNVRLVIERHVAGGAMQTRVVSNISELKQGRTRVLPEPIVWDEL